MKIEVTQVIGEVGKKISQSKPVEFFRERASDKKNWISDAGLTSTLIILGAGIEGVIVGNGGHSAIAMFGIPLSMIVTTGVEMVYDTRQYMKRQREQKVLDDLQHLVYLWDKTARTAPPDHYQLPLPLR